MCRHQAGLENEPVLCSQRPENDPVCFLVTLGEPKNKRTLFQWVARPAGNNSDPCVSGRVGVDCG